MKGVGEVSTGRNSASPASVLSQGSNEGLVYSENGGGMQVRAQAQPTLMMITNLIFRCGIVQ